MDERDKSCLDAQLRTRHVWQRHRSRLPPQSAAPDPRSAVEPLASRVRLGPHRPRVRGDRPAGARRAPRRSAGRAGGLRRRRSRPVGLSSLAGLGSPGAAMGLQIGISLVVALTLLVVLEVLVPGGRAAMRRSSASQPVTDSARTCAAGNGRQATSRHVRHAGPARLHAGRPAAGGVHRGVLDAAGPGAGGAVGAGAVAARPRAGPAALGGLCRVRPPAGCCRVHRPGAPRPAALRCRRGGQGAASRHRPGRRA